MRTVSSATPLRLDSVSHSRGRLVLPCTYDQPALFLQGGIVPSVTLSVPRQLGSPPIRVRSGSYSVLRAPVPEAAVDLNRDPGPGEYDVWAAPQSRDVDAVTEPPSMQLTSYGHLGPSARGSHARHEARDRRATRGWSGAALFNRHRGEL